jgi:hypothetical protein
MRVCLSDVRHTFSPRRILQMALRLIGVSGNAGDELALKLSGYLIAQTLQSDAVLEDLMRVSKDGL